MYTFTLSELNAKWDEKRYTTQRSFSVSSGKVVGGITSAGYSTGATTFWR